MTTEHWRILVSEMCRLCLFFGGTWDFSYRHDGPLAIDVRWFPHGAACASWAMGLPEMFSQHDQLEFTNIVRVKIQCAILERAQQVLPVLEESHV